MADMQEVRWKEFEDLGEEAVRKRLDIGDEEKAGLHVNGLRATLQPRRLFRPRRRRRMIWPEEPST